MKNILLTTTILGLLSVPAAAHEIQDNRATLVLRDQTHLSVTLFILYTDALHLALAPQRPLPEFLAVYSAMTPEKLAQELLRAQTTFQSATHLYLSPSKPVGLTNWIWPAAPHVRALLQRRTMEAIIDPNGHSHEEPTEIHADANTQAEITSVQVQFPEEFQKMLVVSYRPSQVSLERKTLSPAIRF